MTKTHWLQRNAVIICGLVVFLVGVVLFVTAGGNALTVGWTAYTPLSGDGPEWPVGYLNRQRVAGIVVVIVGLVVISGALGFKLGKMRSSVISPRIPPR
jgi:heme/copper-type cytochrome/quinol oxidase subunit 1